MRLPIACATLAVLTSSVLAAMTSELTSFGQQCRAIADGADSGQDFVLQACTDSKSVSTYILYNEGTRMSVGFGRVPHTAAAGLASERQASWPVQWLGKGAGSAFEPMAVIARFQPLGEAGSSLYVFRLLENGMSCVAGTVGPEAGQNQKAIELAERAVSEKTCVGEPTRLEP